MWKQPLNAGNALEIYMHLRNELFLNQKCSGYNYMHYKPKGGLSFILFSFGSQGLITIFSLSEKNYDLRLSFFRQYFNAELRFMSYDKSH